MHPANAPCLSALGPLCCILSNNHVLDWGRLGLVETLETLDRLGLRHAGAGRTEAEAVLPAVIDAGSGRRVVVLSVGSTSSGIPSEWAAAEDRPGVHLLETQDDPVGAVADLVRRVRAPGDVAILSIHWGGNWGFRIPAAQRALAHRWIDEAGVDVVHGHSSHHVKGVEIHRGRLILYGCGDLLND